MPVTFAQCNFRELLILKYQYNEYMCTHFHSSNMQMWAKSHYHVIKKETLKYALTDRLNDERDECKD